METVPWGSRQTTRQDDLEQELEPKGDPMSLVRWTTKSLHHLVQALAAKGHRIQKSALAEILHDLGFSLHGNKKSIEGTSHPDRDAQFHHLNSTCKVFEQNGNPIISVDCKKKELLGNFKNGGREWQATGEDTRVNVHDFLSLADGKAVYPDKKELLTTDKGGAKKTVKNHLWNKRLQELANEEQLIITVVHCPP